MALYLCFLVSLFSFQNNTLVLTRVPRWFISWNVNVVIVYPSVFQGCSSETNLSQVVWTPTADYINKYFEQNSVGREYSREAKRMSFRMRF